MIGLFDTPLYKGRRNILVNQLKAKGSFNERILRAIAAVPRHIFVMEGMEEFAYNDTPVAIEAGQTISQPSTVALQTQLLGLFDNPASTDGIRQNPRVLEIGTGCGYQSAVLFYLGAEVFTIERQEELYKQARKNQGIYLIMSKKILIPLSRSMCRTISQTKYICTLGMATMVCRR